jgi:hypothetical protein
MNRNVVVLETTEGIFSGGLKLKKFQNFRTLLLFSLLLIAFSVQISIHLSQIDLNSYLFSSSGEKDVFPLRKDNPLPIIPSGYGIIPLSGDLRKPFASIENPKPEYIPGDTIRVKNRFEPPDFNDTSKEGWALVQQDIMIFLSTNGTRPDPLNMTTNASWVNDHWRINGTTNGTPFYGEGAPAITNETTHGVLDITFTIPDIITLKDQYKIIPGDLVEIYQYYPSGNITSQMQGLDPFGFPDTFNLTAYASFSAPDYIKQDETEGGNSRLRQGDNGSTTLYARWGTTPVPNVIVNATLHNASDDAVITNGSYGTWFYLQDETTGNPDNSTDASGNLKLFLDTTYPTTPEGTYYFNVTGNFTGTGYNTSYYESTGLNIDFTYVNFTIANDMDTVTIELISAKGYTTNKDISETEDLDPPNENITIVTYRVTATNYYTGTDYYPAGVPVNATLDIFPLGVTLSIDGSTNGSAYWAVTDTSGYVKFNITAEFPTAFNEAIVNITAVANFVNNFSPNYPPSTYGRLHRFMQSNDPTNRVNASASYLISIDPDFWVGEVDIIYINTTEIRPGESAKLVFKVFSSQSEPGTIFEKVPVNITLDPLINGAVVTVINPDPYIVGYYYYTNASGMIEIEISTDIGATPASVQPVIFNATVDFENDSNARWIGSQHFGYNDFTEFDKTWHTTTLFSNNLDIDPQYFIGEIFLPGGSPNATRIQQNETIQYEFGVRLIDKDGVPVAPSSIINGINISILINGSATQGTNYTEVVEGFSQNSSLSIVIFTIKTNVSGETPEADYNITAIADFGAAKSLIYNFTHPTVPGDELPGKWVNGTDSVNQISKLTSFFTVKNIDRITTYIESIVDSTHSDAGKSGEYYEVYRGTTRITVNGTYKNLKQEPIGDRNITISLNYTQGASTIIVPLVNMNTYSNGSFRASFNLSTSLPLKDTTIFTRDTGTPAPDPQEDRVGIEKVRLMSEVNLNYAISGVSGNALYLGQQISVSGQLRDDQNVVITNITEFSGRLSLLGWNATEKQQEGAEDTTGIDINGYYNLNYLVPVDFSGDELYINLSVTAGPNLEHYRPINIGTPYNIYRGIKISSLQLHPNNGTSIPVNSGQTYLIRYVDLRNFSISGVLLDLKDRPLRDKTIRHTWNLNQNSTDVNSVGGFSLQYSFPGWNNITVVWSLEHILDNGTILSTIFSLTLIWEVYDITAPTLEILSPIYYNNTVLNQPTITYILNVTDPGYLTGYVSGGLDNSSVTIWIDGVPNLMIPGVGYQFSYPWTPTNTADGTIYNITLSARDLGGLQNTTGTIWTVIDVKEPTVTIDIADVVNENGYIIVNPEDGTVIISGTITDSGSITGWNSGVDNASVRILIHLPDEIDTADLNESVMVTLNDYSFEWTVFLIVNDLPSRVPEFTTEGWDITLICMDNAGNEGRETKRIKLDNQAPYLVIDNVAEWPERIDEEFNITVSFHDYTKSGIWNETLRFELVEDETDDVIETIYYDDPRINKTDNGVILFLHVSELKNGLYYVRVSIFDNTGNEGVISEFFTVRHPGPPFDLLYYIILAPFALGGGFGLAVLYERFKTSRGM